MHQHYFYHKSTGTYSYLIWTDSKKALLIDPVADFDKESQKVSYESAQSILSFVEEKSLSCLTFAEQVD